MGDDHPALMSSVGERGSMAQEGRAMQVRSMTEEIREREIRCMHKREGGRMATANAATSYKTTTDHQISSAKIATNAYVSIHQLLSQTDQLLLLLLFLLLLLLLSPLPSPPLLSQTLLGDKLGLLNNLPGLVHALLPLFQSLLKQLPFIRAKATGRLGDRGNRLDADEGLGLRNSGDNEL